MSIKRILILFLFTVVTAFSQKKEGTVTYKKVIGKVTYNATVEQTKEYKEKYKNQNTSQDRLFKAIEKEGEKFNLELVFSKQNSVYHLIEPMNKDSKSQYAFNLAKIIYKAGNKFYYSTKEKTITKEVDFLENKYLIENKNDFATWKMLNRQEKIGKYTCYLAEREYEYLSRKGKTIVKQTVWYTTELPFPFGPAEFVGFPGLVLKVKSGTIVYNAKLIKMNPHEKIVFNTEKRGKKISQKEFDKIAKEAKERLINN